MIANTSNPATTFLPGKIFARLLVVIGGCDGRSCILGPRASRPQRAAGAQPHDLF